MSSSIIDTLDLEDMESQDIQIARDDMSSVQKKVFPAGTLLFKRGDIRHCAFLLDLGAVEIFGNDEGGTDKFLCAIGEGEIFGEMALIDNSPRTASAVTTKECEIFIIPRESFHKKIIGLDPMISLLISLLIERYRITRIHMPESVKQDNIGDFIRKLGRHEHLPDEVIRLRNTEQQRHTALQEMKLEQDLRQGLADKEFIPYLQPILDLKTSRVAGFEALIRWQSADKGMVFPDDFIPVAERTGLVQQLDMLMLEKVCAMMPDVLKKLPALSKDDSRQDFFISVNMSGINFETLDVVNQVRGLLMKYEIDPRHIKLEITESALIGDADQAEKVLQGLKILGVSVALDDFGTGYSSLGYLHKFTIDDLKIDRSFVMQLHDGSRTIDIVRAIIGLAKNFKLNVVAEGIEQEKDIAALLSLDCDYGQGYLYSKPMPVDAALEYLEKSFQV